MGLGWMGVGAWVGGDKTKNYPMRQEPALSKTRKKQGGTLAYREKKKGTKENVFAVKT